MSTCHCRFDGPLMTKEHRDHHRAWEAERDAAIPTPVGITWDDMLAMMMRQDDLEARLVECERRLGITPLPPTPGAQAILTRTARNRR